MISRNHFEIPSKNNKLSTYEIKTLVPMLYSLGFPIRKIEEILWKKKKIQGHSLGNSKIIRIHIITALRTFFCNHSMPRYEKNIRKATGLWSKLRKFKKK